MKEPPPYPGTPRWVKVLGVIALIAVLLFVVLMLAGGPHRPRDHGPFGILEPEVGTGEDRTYERSQGGHE